MSSSNPIKPVLERGLGLMRKHGWAQHNLFQNGSDETGEVLQPFVFTSSSGIVRSVHHFCAAGAIMVQAHANQINHLDMWAALDTLHSYTLSGLLSWNDTPGRTFKDIEELYEKAIAACSP